MNLKPFCLTKEEQVSQYGFSNGSGEKILIWGKDMIEYLPEFTFVTTPIEQKVHYMKPNAKIAPYGYNPTKKD